MAILAGAAIAPALAAASPVLVLPAADPNAEKGIGLAQWTQMTADLSTATGGQIASSASALDDLANVESYNGLWIDLGLTTGTLTSTETANLQAYIQTGRRVVMIGGDPVYATWDASLLGAVGGAVTASKFAGSSSTRSYVALTTGVSSLDLAASGVAASGTSLFQDRVATTWGPAANALVLLDADAFADSYLTEPGNAQFASNVASWIAGGLGSTTNWKTAAGGSWTTASSWTAGQMPSVADTATFNLGQNASGNFGYTVALAASKAVGNVSVLADKVTLSLPGASAMTVSQTIGVSPPVNQAGSLTLTAVSTAAVVTATSISLGGNSGSSAALSLNTGITLSASNAAVGAGATLQINGGVLHLSGGASGAGMLSQNGGSSTLSTVRLDSLSIGAGAVSIAPQNPADEDASVSVLNSVSIAKSGSTFLGTLDLSDNDLIVENGDLSALTAAVASGYDGGKWDGPGIDSSAAADDSIHRMTLGILQNSDGDGHKLYGVGAPLGLFDGQDPAYDAILIRYTVYGDNDLSGAVTASDILRDVPGPGGWSTGDFNYDGVVDSRDIAIQSAELAGASSTVPEPSMLLSGSLFAIAMTRRRLQHASTSR